jgi:predicted HTH domain antitoxin
MATVEIKISDELLKAAKVPQERSSEEVAKLLALELYRERAISLGRAAELAAISTAEFMRFAGEREVELDFDLDNLEHDRQTLESLNQ